MRAEKQLKVLLVDESCPHGSVLVKKILSAGHSVSEFNCVDSFTPEMVNELRPDLIVVRMMLVHQSLIDQIQCTFSQVPTPIVLFCGDDSSDVIERAIEAGVSSYIVDDCLTITTKRLEVIVEVALARFKENQALRDELHKTKTSLKERKTIEQAKGLLMNLRHCSESEAYQLLRKSAMDNNQRMIEVASSLISAQHLIDSGAAGKSSDAP